MNDASITQLLERARDDDREALAELFQLVRAKLERLARSIMGANLKARLRDSDVLQSTYLQILRDFPDFRGDDLETFGAWAAQLLRHCVSRQARYFGRQKRKAPDGVEAGADPERGVLPSPSVAVARVEDVFKAQEALEKLPENYRQVIVLRVMEDRSFEEIAELMDCSVAAARTLLWRARAALAVAAHRAEGETARP